MGLTASVGKLTPPSRRRPEPSMPWANVYDTGTGSCPPSVLAAAEASASSVGLWSNLRKQLPHLSQLLQATEKVEPVQNYLPVCRAQRLLCGTRH